MVQDEFDHYMSGDFILPNAWDSGVFMLESMHLMNEHFSTFDDLFVRQKNLISNATMLRNDMLSFLQEVTTSASNILKRTPLEVRRKKMLPNLDYEDPKIKDLPSPITPEIVQHVRIEPKLREELTAECNLFAETLKLSEDLKFPLIESKSMEDLKLKYVNYDIDLSDLSTDNSSAEDDSKISRSLLQYSMMDGGDVQNSKQLPTDLNIVPENSLIDSSDSPTSNLWLPSPLKPTQGVFFTNTNDIPSIPCFTGEFQSTNQESQFKQDNSKV